jgi:hypothetical protein
MKPVQVGILVVAAALGGAVVMKVWQRPQPIPAAAPAPAAAQVPAPPPAPVGPPALEPAPVPAGAKATPTQVYHPQPARQPDPVVVARSEPAVAAPVPTPEPPPPPTPPARTEPENATPPPTPAPEPEPRRVTLNAGMPIPVRLVDGLSSERNLPGDAFTATLDSELVVNGFVIAERGARVEGRVVTADRGGKVKGVAALTVELTRLHTADGQNVAIHTDSFERRAEASQRQDAEKVAAGAAVGAIIGAIAGGGKGAAVGAGVGGGAGAGDVLLTRGKPATLPSETRLSFRLSAAVTLTEQR